MPYRRLIPWNLGIVLLLLLTVLPARATPMSAADSGLGLTWRDGARPANPSSVQPISPVLDPAFHGPLAVLAGSGDRRPYSYSVTLVNIRAQVVASVRSSDTRLLRLGNNTGTPPLPPVSVSATHLFYIAGGTTIRELAADGSSRVVTHIPGGPHTRSAFAVSADEQQIAVAVMDFSADPGATAPTGKPYPWPTYGPPVRESLYTENLHGGHRHELFTSVAAGFDATLVWPVGWIGGALVLAVGPEGVQQNNLNPYSAWYGYQVVNARTGVRLANICKGSFTPGPNVAAATGPVSTAGTVCATGSSLTTVYAQSWQEKCMRFPLTNAYFYTVLSPDGTWIASLDKSFNLVLASRDGRLVSTGLRNVGPLGWIDSHHFLAASSGLGDSNLPSGTYVITVSDTGSTTHAPISANLAGVSAVDGFQGVLPGGLGEMAPKGPPGSGACSG